MKLISRSSGRFFVGEKAMDYELYNEDCITGMDRLPDGSVDAIICDPPYGTTDCYFDKRLPLEEM